MIVALSLEEVRALALAMLNECHLTSWASVLKVAGLCAVKGWQQKQLKPQERVTLGPSLYHCVLRGVTQGQQKRPAGKHNSFCYHL